MYALRSLSPRRRLFLGVLLGLAVAAAAVLALAGGTGPAGPADQSRPGTVLLVPGYGGSTASLQPLASRLRATGRTVIVVSLPDAGVGDLRDQASTLERAVRTAEDAGSPSVDLVGYSAGGVTVRLWVREHDGADRARRVVTLGSPHHGTTLAAQASAALGGCEAACTELTPGSSLLTTLNRGDETPDGPVWTAIWTADDRTVVPPASGALAGAVDVRLQDVCPGAVVAHGDLPRDGRVQGLVLRALAAAPLTSPGPCPV